MKFVPHNYQQEGIDFLDRVQCGGLLLDPGGGKTAITLSHIVNQKARAMVVAPLRVIYNVWGQEAAKWDCFKHLRFSLVHGTPAQREAALCKDADIYLINPEGIKWLLDSVKGFWPNPDMLVVDESTKFKNWSAKRTVALRKMVSLFDSRVILTGTPVPNSMMDMFSQMFIADMGISLGKTITQYRSKYFFRGGFNGYDWILRAGAKQKIEKAIAPRSYRIDMKKHLKLPGLLVNDIVVEMPKGPMKDYRKLQREMLMQLPEKNLIASNAGSKYLMCRQVANGFLYTDKKTREYEDIHRAKLEVVEGLLDELQGKPALVAYQFEADYLRLCQHLKMKIPRIAGKSKEKDTTTLIERWNCGKVPVLAVQPAALSHGINMQGAGNDIIWLGVTDSLETYTQLNARIYRQGVKGNVRIHRIICKGTVDELCLRRITDKDARQQSLLDALRDLTKETI